MIVLAGMEVSGGVSLFGGSREGATSLGTPFSVILNLAEMPHFVDR